MVELGNDAHEKRADSSNAPSIGNYDHEENISSFGELCMPLSVTHPIIPSSAPQNAARHMKGLFPDLHKKASDYKNDCQTSNAASVATVRLPDVAKDNAKMHSTTRKDMDIVSGAVDPFWPFCMFELRGNCNDEECPWQHVEHHAWRKSKHTKHSKPSFSGLFYVQTILILLMIDYGAYMYGFHIMFAEVSTLMPGINAGWIPYGLFQHILPVPTYRVGSNLIRADLNLIQSVLASSIWQYWQRGFCASFPFPLSVQRVLPSDAPSLQAGDDSSANFDRDRQLLNLRMLDSRKVGRIRHITVIVRIVGVISIWFSALNLSFQVCCPA